MTKEALKLCKNCKHYDAHREWCDHPANGIMRVYGHARVEWVPIIVSIMRNDLSFCGIKGKLWEPKKPWYKFWS